MADKRQDIIDTALNLFYNKGIHAVGINEIIKESGVAKKTLYNHFPGKEDLILETVKYRDKKFTNWLNEKLSDVPPGKLALIALFRALDDWFNNRVTTLGHFRGCFFINTSAEYGDPKSPINQACRAHKNNVKAIIKKQVDQFEKDPEKNRTLTDMICMLKEGAITTAMLQKDLNCAKKLVPIVSKLVH